MPDPKDDDECRAMEALQIQPPSTVNRSRRSRPLLSESSPTFALIPAIGRRQVAARPPAAVGGELDRETDGLK
jgi:hypothetical protein